MGGDIQDRRLRELYASYDHDRGHPRLLTRQMVELNELIPISRYLHSRSLAHSIFTTPIPHSDLTNAYSASRRDSFPYNHQLNLSVSASTLKSCTTPYPQHS
ncbi:hypothetical protein FIBSPDRAFT_861232 [Athelia psychrophila]|uniref:Uncharacterized protein n=1 Tax=Athelia psychrophila TaxID=1759441 RepID=A0A166JFA7_9AGAM|nr:hypothetical protein FIBSPDRAFT_861232 [Fibularhizoctonia sp. CBS 109695]